MFQFLFCYILEKKDKKWFKRDIIVLISFLMLFVSISFLVNIGKEMSLPGFRNIPRLVGCFGFYNTLSIEVVFKSISGRLPERERGEGGGGEKTETSTASPCPTIIQISGMPGTRSVPSTTAPPGNPRLCTNELFENRKTKKTQNINLYGILYENLQTSSASIDLKNIRVCPVLLALERMCVFSAFHVHLHALPAL